MVEFLEILRTIYIWIPIFEFLIIIFLAKNMKELREEIKQIKNKIEEK